MYSNTVKLYSIQFNCTEYSLTVLTTVWSKKWAGICRGGGAEVNYKWISKKGRFFGKNFDVKWIQGFWAEKISKWIEVNSKKREVRLKSFEVNLRSEFRRKWGSKNTSKWILESKWWFMGRFAHWERFIWRLTSSVKDFQCIAQGHQSILTHCFIIMALGLWQHVRRFHFLLPLLSSLFYYHKLRSATHTNNTHVPNLFKAIATLIQARFRLQCEIKITQSTCAARCARP